MALIACPECNKKVSEAAGACPKCGRPLTAEDVADFKAKQQRAEKVRTIGCLSIIGILLVMALINSINSAILSSAIPSDVSYSIIEESTPLLNHSLTIRLNKRVSEQTLRAIAHKLKSQESRHFEGTGIFYYLPGMEVDAAGCWATTHFSPELKVRIIGLTVEEADWLTAQPEPANREVIGRWLNDTIGACRITIFRERGRLFMEESSAFSNGGGVKWSMVERKSTIGRRFVKVDPSHAGDSWVIGSNGNLQCRDDDYNWIIYVATKIPSPSTSPGLGQTTTLQTQVDPSELRPHSAQVQPEREEAARRKLDLAIKLIDAGKPADSFLHQVIKDYPETEAAQEARILLD